MLGCKQCLLRARFPAPAANETAGPCACTATGMSGGVATGLRGCGQWDMGAGNATFWCYAVDPGACPSATPSADFAGAGWVPCSPDAEPADEEASGEWGWARLGALPCPALPCPALPCPALPFTAVQPCWQQLMAKEQAE